MPGVPIRYTDQPITYAVSAIVTGGQLVDADQSTSQTNATATVTPSGAGSKICVGAALRDAAPAGTDSATDAAARPPNTTVARSGCVVPVTFAAASHFGDLLKTAAAGTVTPWVDGTDDPDLIVAQNVDDGGYVAASAVGYISLRVS
jgi:hypothetical protein